MTDPRRALSVGYMPLDVIDAAGEVRHRAGGTAGNVAAILAFLGWDSALAGRVGDDPAGSLLLADLASAGVDSSLLAVERGAKTNRLVHRVRERGHRYLFTCPHCRQKLPRSRPLRLDDVDRILAGVSAPSVFFFDRANPATVALAEQYGANGALVVFEPSTPASAELIERAMAVARVVKGSHEHGSELVEAFASGRRDQIRVITEGSLGARLRLPGGRWQHVGVYETPVLDTAGAGDWTTAGLLHHLVDSASLTASAAKDGILFGHALASLNCRLPGARGLMDGGSRREILAMARRLADGKTVRVEQPEATPEPRLANHCEWCLLSIAPVAQRSAAAQ